MEYPKRKNLRLKEYDYSQNGYYFITLCTKNRKPLFWANNVGADIIRPNLSLKGKIAKTAIDSIAKHYSNVKVDEYVIMPDHIHLILKISKDDNGRILSAPTIMRVVGQMKRWVSKKVGFSVWQKSFYEHIIRDERDYVMHLSYMEQNPAKKIYNY